MTSIFRGHDQGVRPHGTPSSGMPTPSGATAVLDQHLRFTGWSREAEELFGLASDVAALAALDLAPDELLARLDDLVARTGIPPSGAAEAEDQALGVTCLYAIYDPVSRHCVMARAGHLPPVLVTPDGHTELVDLPAGPPLGLGGLPFECADIELP
jgi:hypothetical protein